MSSSSLGVEACFKGYVLKTEAKRLLQGSDSSGVASFAAGNQTALLQALLFKNMPKPHPESGSRLCPRQPRPPGVLIRCEGVEVAHHNQTPPRPRDGHV